MLHCLDYSGLENPSAIESYRNIILMAFRAVTTGTLLFIEF